jgi:hypothetical protein
LRRASRPAARNVRAQTVGRAARHVLAGAEFDGGFLPRGVERHEVVNQGLDLDLRRLLDRRELEQGGEDGRIPPARALAVPSRIAVRIGAHVAVGGASASSRGRVEANSRNSGRSSPATRGVPAAVPRFS